MDSIDLERVQSDQEYFREKLRDLYDKIETDSLQDILDGNVNENLTPHEKRMTYFYRGALTVLVEYEEELEKSDSAYH